MTQPTRKGPTPQGPRIDALEAQIVTLNDQIKLLNDLKFSKQSEDNSDSLTARLANLELVVVDIASQSGTANLLPKYGFKRLEPTAKQMRKYA